MRQFAKKEVSEDCRAAVRFILSRNIVCGNALSLKKVDENGNDTDEPIIFSEWAFVTGSKMQRKDFRFDKLLAGEYEPPAKKKTGSDYQISLFDVSPDDEGELLTSYITDYRRVWEYGK